jgi:NitT/TauT family transport system permease protein
MSVADSLPAPSVTLPTGGLVVGVLLWALATSLLAIPSYLLPAPGQVATRFVANPDLYARSARTTATRIILGGAGGVGVGFAVGVVVAHVPPLRRALLPYLVVARVLPKIAVAPVLLIYLGTGFETGAGFVALVTFFPMVVNTVAGLDAVPDRYADLFTSVDAPSWSVLVHLRLPYALPDVFAGLRQSATLAVVGAVVAEWIVATEGLGALMLFALEDVQTDVMFAALLLLFAEGFVLYGAVAAVERRVGWRRDDA